MLAPRELPLDRHPAAVYLSRLAQGPGRRGMRRALNIAASSITAGQANAERLAWHRLEYQHTAGMLAAVTEKKYAPATVNLIRSAIRGALKEAWRLGLMTAEQYQRAVDLPRARGKTVPKGRALELAELRALLQVCRDDRTIAGARDAAFIGIGYGCGLRQSELVALTMEDYRAGNKGEDHELLIHGKGKKERLVYLPEGASNALWEWLKFRGFNSGSMFYPVTKGGHRILNRSRLNNSNAAFYICRKRAREAGVRPFSPQDLRRSFISHLFDAGADPSTIAAMAGHASIHTTATYDRRGDETKRKAATLIHVPYGYSPADDDGAKPTEKITATL